MSAALDIFLDFLEEEKRVVFFLLCEGKGEFVSTLPYLLKRVNESGCLWPCLEATLGGAPPFQSLPPAGN